jgi:DNA-binding CsgD family transcriptional regulator
MLADESGLIDRIYEAALMTDLWPAVLGEIAGAAEAEGGVLFTVSGERMRWTASGPLVPVFEGFIAEGWVDRNPRAARGVALDHAGFVNDLDLFSPEEIEAEPLYGYLRAKGFGWCTGTFVRLPGGDGLIFHWERRIARGPVERATLDDLDGLRPHLARAAFLSARLGLEQARAAAATLGAIGLPAAVLSHGHGVLAANDLLEALTPAVVQDRRGRVRLTEPRADALLAGALDALGRPGGPEGVRSIPITARPGRGPMVAHLVPVRGAARDVFSLASSLLVLTPVTWTAVAAAEVIQGLFDLTAAEARVARGVAEGRTVEQIGLAAGLSPQTVRAQLKAVFAKTGLSRQADLVAVLAGTGLGEAARMLPEA